MAHAQQTQWRAELVGLTIGGMVGLLVAFTYDRGMWEDYEWRTRDLRQRTWQSHLTEHPDIVLVLIDEESIARLRSQCSWPWPRQIHSLVVSFLKAGGAKAIVFDVLFVDRAPSMIPPESLRPIRGRLKALRAGLASGKTPPHAAAKELMNLEEAVGELDQRNDDVFAEDMRGAGNVYLSLVFDRAGQEIDPRVAARVAYVPGESFDLPMASVEAMNSFPLLPVPTLMAAAHGVGHINFIPDRDGINRSVKLFLGHEGRLYPSLAMRVAMGRLAADPQRVRVGRGAEFRLDKAKHELLVPMNAEGKLLLNFKNTFKKVPYYLVLASALRMQKGQKIPIDPKDFAGKTVIVAASAKGLLDLRATPTQAQEIGAAVHAQALANLLDGSHLMEAPPAVTLVIILAAALLVGIALHRLGPIVGTLLSLACLFGYWALAFYFFRSRGLLLDLVAPSVAVVVCMIGVIANSFATAERRHFFEKQLLEKELGIAHEIQMSLMPDHAPQFATVAIAGFSQPCDDTGGDFYDFVELGDGRFVLALGDVSGHGLGPALLMAAAHSYLHGVMDPERTAAEMLTRMNDLLCKDVGESRFVTMFLGVLDPRTRRLAYSSAGHESPLLLRAKSDEVEELESMGMPLGMMPEQAYEDGPATRMEPGDVLVILTDGVFEAMNKNAEQFGHDRLVAQLRSTMNSPPQEIMESLHAAVRSFRGKVAQQDDITMVVVRATEAEAEEAADEVVFEKAGGVDEESIEALEVADASDGEVPFEEIEDS